MLTSALAGQGSVPDEQKPQLLNDLRLLSKIAQEARNKIPRLLLVAVERAMNPGIPDAPSTGEEVAQLLQLVSMVSANDCLSCMTGSTYNQNSEVA
jgi:hypothetical protein